MSHLFFRTQCTTSSCHDVIRDMTQILVHARPPIAGSVYGVYHYQQSLVRYKRTYMQYKSVSLILFFPMIDPLHYAPGKRTVLACTGPHWWQSMEMVTSPWSPTLSGFVLASRPGDIDVQ